MSTHVLPFSPLTTLIRLVPTCQISHTTRRLSNGLPCKFIVPLVRKPPPSLPPLQVPNPKEPTHTMPSRRRYITTHTPSGLSIFSPPPPTHTPPPHPLLPGTSTPPPPSPPLSRAQPTSTPAHPASPRPHHPTSSRPGGTAAIFADLDPDAATSMHRTVSVDYVVVLEGLWSWSLRREVVGRGT